MKGSVSEPRSGWITDPNTDCGSDCSVLNWRSLSGRERSFRRSAEWRSASPA